MQQAAVIGYRSAEVRKQSISENYTGTRSPSIGFEIQKQERVFRACFLPLIG